MGFNVIECGDCGKSVVTTAPRRLYCDSCAVKRAVKRSKRHTQKTKIALAENRPQVASAIQEISDAEKRTLMHAFPPSKEECTWEVFVAVPYSLNASKNRRWSNTGQGHVFLGSAVRKYEAELIRTISRAMSGVAVRQSKLWISIFVQKENHRSDAINVIDTICDALKKAVGLDDRWFCLDRVDWEIVKNDKPMIFLRIAQADVGDKIACSHCGLIKPLDHFPRNKSMPFGRNRSCLACSRIIDAARRLTKPKINMAGVGI